MFNNSNKKSIGDLLGSDKVGERISGVLKLWGGLVPIAYISFQAITFGTVAVYDIYHNTKPETSEEMVKIMDTWPAYNKICTSGWYAAEKLNSLRAHESQPKYKPSKEKAIRTVMV